MPSRGELHFTPDGVNTPAASVTINIAPLTEGINHYVVARSLDIRNCAARNSGRSSMFIVSRRMGARTPSGVPCAD